MILSVIICISLLYFDINVLNQNHLKNKVLAELVQITLNTNR